MHEQNENFNEEIENIRQHQTEVTQLNTRKIIRRFFNRNFSGQKGVA